MTNVAFHVMKRSEILNMTGSDIPNTAGRVTQRRRTQATAKRFAFHANTTNKLNVRPGCTGFTMQVMITPLQLSHVTSVYGFICNSRTWQNDMPAYTELTLQIIMTSSQLGHVNRVYVFFVISVSSIGTDFGVMTHQHTLDLP